MFGGGTVSVLGLGEVTILVETDGKIHSIRLSGVKLGDGLTEDQNLLSVQKFGDQMEYSGIEWRLFSVDKQVIARATLGNDGLYHLQGAKSQLGSAFIVKEDTYLWH